MLMIPSAGTRTETAAFIWTAGCAARWDWIIKNGGGDLEFSFPWFYGLFPLGTLAR